MSAEYFTLNKLPDLTLAQYSAEESGGVSDIIRQHASFYRQINRKGLLFNEVYHLIYLYNPKDQPGRRLKVWFSAEAADDQHRPTCMEEFMGATPLSTYFHFENLNSEFILKIPYGT